jgi:tetratricopeptide (TPR) repeat protein
MQKKYIYTVVGVVVVLLLYFGIKALINHSRQVNETNAMVIYEQAGTALGNDDVEGAITRCQQALPDIRTPENRALCLSLLGEAMGRQQRVNEAEDQFVEAKRLAPTNMTVWMRAGKMYYDGASKRPEDKATEDYTKALTQFTEAMKFCPEREREVKQELLFYQGDILEKLKLFDEAQRRYEELVKIADLYPDLKNPNYDEVVKRLKVLEKE